MNAPRPSEAGHAALSYARRGWPVFPVHGITVEGRCTCRVGADCSDAGKHPRTMNGLSDATTDTATIAAWWQRWPDSNIGLRTDHLVVLDIDPDKGGAESLDDLIADWGRGWTETVTSLTGGGGQHLVYRAPGGMTIRNSASKIAPGIDIRAAGGYVVAPPSWHHSGNQYTWEVGYGPDDRDPADLPDWLLGLLSERGKTDRLRVVVAGDEVLPKVILQARNVALTTIAGVMRRRGLSEPAILAALLATNDERCSPPLGETEVRKIANSIAKYAPADVPFGTAGEPGTEPTDPDTLASRHTLHWAKEAWEPEEPIKEIVSGLLNAGTVAALVAGGGVGKTYLSIDLAMHIVLGREWLGFPVMQGRALFIDEESGIRRMKKRLREASRAQDAPDDVPIAFTSLEGFDLRNPQHIEAVNWAVETSKADIVFIDALIDIIPGADENSSSDIQPVMQTLRQIAERHQVAIVVLHHTNKQGGYRGTTAIKGAVDLMIVAERKEESPRLDFVTEKARDIERIIFSATFEYDKDEESFRFISTRAASEEAGKLSDVQQFVMGYLLRNGRSGTGDIIAAADLHTPTTVRKAISRLQAGGRIQRIEPEPGARWPTYELPRRDRF